MKTRRIGYLYLTPQGEEAVRKGVGSYPRIGLIAHRYRTEVVKANLPEYRIQVLLQMGDDLKWANRGH